MARRIVAALGAASLTCFAANAQIDLTGDVTGVVNTPAVSTDLGVDADVEADVETDAEAGVHVDGHPQGHAHTTSGAWIGYEVYTADGAEIGQIRTVRTNATGEVTGYVVSTPGSAHVQSVVVPASSASLDTHANAVVTTMTRAQLGF